jgi:hypothetical protein
MTLAAGTYFEHLKACLNSECLMHDRSGGEVVLMEKYFRPEETTARERKIVLLFPGPGLAFKLDHDDFDIARQKCDKVKEQPLVALCNSSVEGI